MNTAATAAYREFDVRSPQSEFVHRAGNAVANRAAASSHFERWQLEAIKAIAALGKLPLNWDGYGSQPPAEPVRIWASDLILRTSLGILPQPEFSPESNGGLQLDWRSGHNREIELHLALGQPVEFIKVEGGRVVDEGAFSLNDESKPEELLTWLRRG